MYPFGLYLSTVRLKLSATELWLSKNVGLVLFVNHVVLYFQYIVSHLHECCLSFYILSLVFIHQIL
jgi:hypothetical protein